MSYILYIPLLCLHNIWFTKKDHLKAYWIPRTPYSILGIWEPLLQINIQPFYFIFSFYQFLITSWSVWTVTQQGTYAMSVAWSLTLVQVWEGQLFINKPTKLLCRYFLFNCSVTGAWYGSTGARLVTIWLRLRYQLRISLVITSQCQDIIHHGNLTTSPYIDCEVCEVLS